MCQETCMVLLRASISRVFQLVLLKFFMIIIIVLCFYNNMSRLSLGSSCRANLYAMSACQLA